MLETHTVNRLVINTVLFMLNKRMRTVNFQQKISVALASL